MRERPILFTGPMVRAILAGQKTQTRRPVKPQPPPGGSIAWGDTRYGAGWHVWPRDEFRPLAPVRCPYGAPGDRLWCRETFAELHPEHYTERGRPRDELSDRYGPPRRNGAAYRADCDDRPGSDGERCRKELGYRWTPAIHMPRWACRLVLEVTAVRVERLHAITEDDARAEGMPVDEEPCDHVRRSCAEIGCLGQTRRSTFCGRWEVMYPTGPFAWRANPWVWVVEFRRVEEVPRG